jgi:hypothetical protein
MRKSFAVLAMLLAALAISQPAMAQVERGPVPAPGMVGVGFNMSAAVPRDDTLQTRPQFGISADAYLSRRVSVRGLFATAWMDVVRHSFTGTSSPMMFNGSVVYNFEGGKLHPFLTGGAGVYHFRFRNNDLSGSDTKFGVSFGGGAEWFVTRRDAITGEVTYHAISGPVVSPMTSHEPSFWTIAGGYKKYFN